MMITVHPGCLASPPVNTAMFFRRRVVAWLSDWFARQHHAWTAVWVREAYSGVDREHLHMLVHVPKKLKSKLERALARRWSDPGVVDIRPVHNLPGAVSYLTKQMTAEASAALDHCLRHEVECRHSGAPVANVLGRRMSMTKNLERESRLSQSQI
jgi:hypothetical protein